MGATSSVAAARTTVAGLIHNKPEDASDITVSYSGCVTDGGMQEERIYCLIGISYSLFLRIWIKPDLRFVIYGKLPEIFKIN
jgi:hypothetical protein